MPPTPFSPPFEAFAAANATMIPDIRYVEVTGSGEAFAIGVGDGKHCREIPLPAESAFNESIQRICDSGFTGCVVYVPFKLPDSSIRMFVQPLSDARPLLDQVQLTESEVKGIFRFMRHGMMPESVVRGDESTQLAELRVGIKSLQNTVIESAFRCTLDGRSVNSIQLLTPTSSVFITQRPFLSRSVEQCLRQAWDSLPDSAILLSVHRAKTRFVYCFREPEVMSSAHRLLLPDELRLEMLVHLRRGKENLDLAPLGVDLSDATGIEFKARDHQMFSAVITRHLEELNWSQAESEQFESRVLGTLELLAIHEQIGVSVVRGAVPLLSTIGYPSSQWSLSSWVSVPHLSSASRALAASLRPQETSECRMRLISGLSNSYACYFPEDALITLWAEVESALFSEQMRERLLAKPTIKRIRICLQHDDTLNTNRIDVICQQLAQLKTRSRNEVIYTHLSELTSRTLEDISARLRAVFEVRGRSAHIRDSSSTRTDVEAALAVLRALVIEAILRMDV